MTRNVVKISKKGECHNMPDPREIPEDVREKLLDWYNNKVGDSLSRSKVTVDDTYATYDLNTKFELLSYNVALMHAIIIEFSPSPMHMLIAQSMFHQFVPGLFATMADDFINQEYERSVTPDLNELHKLYGDFKL